MPVHGLASQPSGRRPPEMAATRAHSARGGEGDTGDLRRGTPGRVAAAPEASTVAAPRTTEAAIAPSSPNNGATRVRATAAGTALTTIADRRPRPRPCLISGAAASAATAREGPSAAVTVRASRAASRGQQGGGPPHGEGLNADHHPASR